MNLKCFDKGYALFEFGCIEDRLAFIFLILDGDVDFDLFSIKDIPMSLNTKSPVYNTDDFKELDGGFAVQKPDGSFILLNNNQRYSSHIKITSSQTDLSQIQIKEMLALHKNLLEKDFLEIKSRIVGEELLLDTMIVGYPLRYGIKTRIANK